ncbi:MAG: hypothetical protein ACLTE2_03035 [Eubacteriales bacterium]
MEAYKENELATYCMIILADIGIHYEWLVSRGIQKFMEIKRIFSGRCIIRSQYAQLQANPLHLKPYYVGYREILDIEKGTPNRCLESSTVMKREFHTALLESGTSSIPSLYGSI